MIVTLMKHGKDGRLLYYTIHDRQQSLTSPHALTTLFRTGSGREREKHYDFASLAEMDAMIRSLLSKRIRDGYRVLYSWSRDASWGITPNQPVGVPNGFSHAGLLSKANAALDSNPKRASG
ncbi:MAG TPA: hypothetical protein VMV83_17525 [Rectinemataceae bacterium]|nr:hypothetical protein [Rectinemataceae bacterium]